MTTGPAVAAVVDEVLAKAGPRRTVKLAEAESKTLGARVTHQVAGRITPSRPEWLWKNWLLLRALNLLTGRQGSGKTTFVAHVIAALTTEIPLPGDTGRKPITCGFMSLEEPPDRVVARLHAAGADLDRVHVLGDVEDHNDDGNPYRRRWSLPRDVSILGRLIEELEMELVVIDGLGYSIAGDSHNYAVVGSALAALAGEAERSGAAVLGLVHPPKGAADPVTAAIGSTAWTAIPRISIVLGVDPNDESGQRRVMRVAKTNYKEPESGLQFVIGDDPDYECGFVTGLRADDTAAEDIVGAPVSREEKGERAEAREILRSLLADGPMDRAEVIEASGIGEYTLKRARKDIGVKAAPRRNTLGRVVGWTWSLPADQRNNTRGATASCSPGSCGHTQDKHAVSVPEEQDSESGRLDLDSGLKAVPGTRRDNAGTAPEPVALSHDQRFDLIVEKLRTVEPKSTVDAEVRIVTKAVRERNHYSGPLKADLFHPAELDRLEAILDQRSCREEVAL
jgi:putative DNA primase/helicase